MRQTLGQYTDDFWGTNAKLNRREVTTYAEAKAIFHFITEWKKYLKDKFDFYGIKAVPRREISNQVINQLGLPKKDKLFKIIKELWNQPQREYHHFAMELCDKYEKNIDKNFIEYYEFMLTHKSWWDTVDFISIKLVGNFLKLFPEETKFISNRYVTSNNIWLNRTSILFQLKYKDETNLKILYYNILKLKDSKDFFIQKQILYSNVSNQVPRTQPEQVSSSPFCSRRKRLPASFILMTSAFPFLRSQFPSIFEGGVAPQKSYKFTS